MGMMTAEFQRELNHFAMVEVPKEFKRRQIEIIIYLYKLLIERNPVYKGPDYPGGHSRSNWRVSTAYKENVLGTRSRPTRVIPTETIREYLGAMKAGDTLWIFNNVKYVQYLAKGSSAQAPYPFVEVSIEETRMYAQSRGWM